jgi:hypothetical protein
MSHTDAKQALEIYRRFCKQTESVDEYLGVAKKLQNLLNVPIPNLKHVRLISSYLCYILSICQAPVSLAGALQEYLDDPNFEQNRIEYKTAKMASERNGKNPASKTKPSENEGKLFYFIFSFAEQPFIVPSTTKTSPSKYFNGAKRFRRSEELHAR